MVEWLLDELGVSHRRVELDLMAGEHKRDAYRAIHPLGAVPALVVDGLPIIESLAICLYLADAFPDAGLAPPSGSPDRARYYQWMVYATATLEPKLGPAFVRSLSVEPERRHEVATDAERDAMHEVLAPLQNELARGHLLDYGVSAADLIVGSELWWASQVGLLREHSGARAYLESVTARPSFSRVCG